MENPLLKALGVGLVLAAVGIGLFFLMYFVILNGAEPLIQLMGSLCVPPIIMLVLVGGYYLVTQGKD